MVEPLRTRQIHLDFHNSEHIPDIAADWDPQAFVETLQRAHVNSINVFARCHHGMIYYLPTKYTAHPSLKINLLGEQIAALHRAGIRAPIYVSVGLDEAMAQRHPEWMERSVEGVTGHTSAFHARYKKMCLNSPYLDYVWDQTTEVMDLFGQEVDGLWFDIISQGECVCQYCLAGMAKQGLNPEIAADRQRFAVQVLDTYRRRFSDGVRARLPEALIFHNRGHVAYGLRPTQDTFTHLELESLPSSGQWGYNHYPLNVRYARTWGLPHLGMTAKFHTVWGDFGSFKSLAALEYEVFQMLANGAVCCVGDQLPPRGRLNGPAYEMIGKVYSQVEAAEPWTVGAQAQADIAVFNVETVGADDGVVDTSHAGVLRMLIEGHHQFDLVDDYADWSKYRVLILPDKVPVSEALAAKLRAYLQGGGKIIASFHSGLNPEGTAVFPEWGVEYVGEAPFVPDYVTAHSDLEAPLADTEYVIYERGVEVRPLDGTRTLAACTAPYFNRAWNHFSSHQHTPPELGKGTGYPALTINAAGNVIYLAHPLFAGYRQRAPLWYKKLFLAALQQLLPDPLVLAQAPTTAQVTLLHQPAQKRTIVHLLHYIPERRGLAFDTIEDVIPLHNVPLAFKMDRQPGRVYLAPQGDDLPFEYVDGYVRPVVPLVMGHQMVAAE